MPAWVAIFLPLLLAPLLVLGRYGIGWAAAEWAALIALWLPVLFIKPATWRRGSRWTFCLYVFIMTTLFFALVAMAFGLWLSPWWCLVTSLGAGMLITAGIWPAQMRFYRLQRQSRDAEHEHASSEGITFR
jgi:hypothetical protein